MHPASKLLPALAVSLLALSLAAAPTIRADSPSCPACNDCVQRVLAEIEERGWLGMALHLHERRPGEGLEIQFLEADGPIAEVGLRPGDRVLAFQGVALGGLSSAEVLRLLQGLKPGERVVLDVVQGGERKEITLRARPMTLKAKAQALGSYFIRAAAREREDDRSQPSHPPM